MSRGKSLLLGFLVGGTISAAATLLSAPTSGRNLRSQIKEQSLEWKETIEDLVQDGMKLKEQITQTSKEGIALVNELTQEMKKSVEDWKAAVEPHQDNIHEYLEQIEFSLKELEEKIKKD